MMVRYRAIARSLVPGMLAALTGVTLFLLSSCKGPEPVPQPEPTLEPTRLPTKVNEPITPEPNFAFVFEWSPCYSSVLNTFDNKLTVESNTDPPITSTIDFALSREELGKISQEMSDIDFFSYPEKFSIQLPPNVIRVYTGGPVRYRFDVQKGGQRKVVSWEDEFSEPRDMPWKAEDSEPGRTQAIKLRELIELIQKILATYPEFNRLPTGGCA